jgi:D-beta-D-heptose 7-phosphate kinase/D-beta-D-heptose 1-phosphate adenosyltransferase
MKLPSLGNVHVLVIGDVMLDRYWSGSTRRISQEAPVPVIAVEEVDDRPGGAANVALNVVSLGARCTLVGAVGDDDAGRTLTAQLTAAGVNCDLVVQPDWSTILKLRVLSRKQQLLRTDFESPLPADAARAVAAKASRHLAEVSVVILQDYDKGALIDPATLIEGARVPVVVDPKHKPLSSYRGADVLKPNATELEAAAGPWEDEAGLVERAQTVCEQAQIGAVVTTRGSDGMTVVTPTGHHHLPAAPVDVFDVTGAGDTAAAVLGITRSLGWSPERCARLANVAAAIVVGKSGTAAVSGPELAQAVSADEGFDRGMLSREQLREAIARSRAAGERIVFTNGCFDILHAGHVAYLEEARALGSRLVVAVNDDASVSRLKGPGRPVNGLEQRMRVLAGLESVDWLVAFPEDTPESLLELVQPDVLVKGGDYAPEDVVGAEQVRAAGGEVRVLSLVEDCSTSAIIDRLQDS